MLLRLQVNDPNVVPSLVTRAAHSLYSIPIRQGCLQYQSLVLSAARQTVREQAFFVGEE